MLINDKNRHNLSDLVVLDNTNSSYDMFRELQESNEINIKWKCMQWPIQGGARAPPLGK